MTAGFIRIRSLVGAFALLPITSGSTPHIALRSSEPAGDVRVVVAPSRIALWFTEPPQLPFSRIRLAGASGDVVLGKIAADTGNGIHARVAEPMADGAYKVVWQTASADGHPISGEFSFSVGAPGVAGAMQPEASAPSPASDPRPPSTGSRFVRLLEFAGLLFVLGVIVFVHGVLPPLAARGVQTADASQQARGLGAVAAAIYLVAAVIRLVRQSGAVGAEGQAFTTALVDIITGSAWGHGWLIGAGGAILVIAGFGLRMRRLSAGSPTALTGALAMTLSPALSGHAAAATWFIASVSADALHVAAIGAWLGALAVVVLVGIPAMARVQDGNADAAVSALVNSFHPIALLAAPLAVFAGVCSSALRLGSFGALTSSRYGEVLIVKLIGVALVAGVGLWNSMRARRRLGTPQGTRSLRRTALTEVLLAVLVLWATTDLIATPLPTAAP
jgi:copper transport protein